MAEPDPTRAAALHLLHCVLDQRRPIDAGLREVSGPARDRAAGHRLAAAVLRRLGTLDAAIEPWLRRAPPAAVRHILRIGAAGLLLLDTPPHAAVATSVALARSTRHEAFTGLVNAVLRRLAADGPALLQTLDGPRLDTPSWLWASWGAEARAIATAHQMEAPLDISLKPGLARDGGAWAEAAALPNGSLRLPPGTAVALLPGYEAGDFWVQDAAATLPAALLRPAGGETVIDLCAAPGGKTAQLASAGAQVIAVERDPVRLARLQENMRRLRLGCRYVEADATEWLPETKVDAVLLDAPCSATGTIRRHPDLPHLKRLADLGPLADQQDRLLAQAGHMLKPGGRLIYAVCSLQAQEGVARIAAALRGGVWEEDPFSADEVAAVPEALTDESWVRTHPALWPERGGMDGFFIARLRRC